jgi:sigma-B regulation protein RsbQ
VPCLILQHRTDTLAPVSVGEYVHAHLAGSTLKVLEVQGHCSHMSEPALVIDAIRSFLAAPV